MREGWKVKTLGDICYFENGDRGKNYPSKKHYVSEGVPFITATNVENGQILDNLNYISEERFNLLSRGKFKKGDFLFCLRGSLGKFGYVSTNMAGGIASSMVIVRPVELETEWLFYYFLSDDCRKEIDNYKGGAAQPNLGAKDLKKFKISIPPRKEQKQIAAILDEAFKAIDQAKANIEKNIENVKELFDGYLERFFTSKDDEFEVRRLKDIAKYFNGLTYRPADVSDEGMIVLRSSNIQSDKLDFQDIVRVNLKVKEKIIVRDGDILMCSRNGSKRLVGKTAPIVNLNEEMTFGTFMMIIRSEYNPYLLWFFKSSNFKRQISGGENTMINQITRYMLDDIEVSMPSANEQERIVKFLDNLYNETQNIQEVFLKKIEDLNELKKSILQKAFNGELINKSVQV